MREGGSLLSEADCVGNGDENGTGKEREKINYKKTARKTLVRKKSQEEAERY